MLRFGSAADDVFNHHDSAVNDQSKIQSTETHQIARHVEYPHQNCRKQHRKRDDRGDQQRPAPITEQQQQNEDDQRGSLEQVCFDRRNCAFDKSRAIVKRLNRNTRRQRFADLIYAGGDALGDRARVFALEHDRHSGDDLAFAVRCCRSLPDAFALDDLTDILDINGNAFCSGFNDDIGDVLRFFDESHAA